MNKVATNFLANLSGASWTALMQLAFVPVYIRYLGLEAWGLVGFYLALQAALQVLDFGLSPTMNRTMARYSVQPEKAAEARDFLRTMETGYWAIGLTIALVLWLSTPYLAGTWFNRSEMAEGDVRNALLAMSVLVGLQWPMSLYQGGLLGLQRQVPLAIVQITTTTARAVGAALVLSLWQPTVVAFFLWYSLISLVQVAMTSGLLWRSVPQARGRPTFRPALFTQIWRFAAGMSGIGASALLLTQLDKLILSRLLPLDVFGHYVLATVVASGLVVMITPIFNAVFPRLSALSAAKSDPEVAKLYHAASQLMAALVGPAALVLAMFSSEILRVWTRDAETAANVAPLVSVLALGTALNGLMHLPYALQLSHGWTSIGVRINLLLVVLMVPAITMMSWTFGAMGAACAWVALNALYMAVGVPLTHRRLLPGHGGRWILQDLLVPITSALAVVAFGRWILAGDLAAGTVVLAIPIVAAAACAAAVLMAPSLRAAAIVHIGPALRRFS